MTTEFKHVPQDGKDITEAEIKRIIKEENVKFIELQFVDINGQVKSLTIPSEHIDKALENEMMLDGSSIKGFRSIETSDMLFFPDKNTFKVLPWREFDGVNTARLICDIHNADGTPFEGCPRCNLKRMMAEAKKLGYTMNVGPEVEFFLFKRDEENHPTKETIDRAGYYDIGPDDLGEDIRAEIALTLQAMDFDIEALHHEVADSQHEIDFKYADILTAADNVATFKVAVKSIAAQYGLHATFMAKPIFGINGSGMHCNISLFKNGKNAFYDAKTETQLSDVAMHSIGGLLKHVKGITAVCNPTVNSYKRLVPGYEAPVYIAWAGSNRSPLIRVPASRGMGTRLELRSVDPMANPYLAMAVLLEAGLDGIINKIEAPAPIETNIYSMSPEERKEAGIIDLPSTLRNALKALETDEVVRQALGNHIYTNFLDAKRLEWASYATFVSQWEIDNYLDLY